MPSTQGSHWIPIAASLDEYQPQSAVPQGQSASRMPRSVFSEFNERRKQDEQDGRTEDTNNPASQKADPAARGFLVNSNKMAGMMGNGESATANASGSTSAINSPGKTPTRQPLAKSQSAAARQMR